MPWEILINYVRVAAGAVNEAALFEALRRLGPKVGMIRQLDRRETE